MKALPSIIIGSVVAASLSVALLVPQPAFASGPFIGKTNIVASPNPNEDGSCPYTVGYKVSAEVLQKPFYGLFGWETSADGGKTWESISYSTLVVEKDSEGSSFRAELTTSISDDDVVDGKKHTYQGRWFYVYGSFKAVSEPAVFSCGGTKQK